MFSSTVSSPPSSNNSSNMEAHSSSDNGGWVVVSGPQLRSNAKANDVWTEISVLTQPNKLSAMNNILNSKQKLIYIVSGTFVAFMTLAIFLLYNLDFNSHSSPCTMIGCWSTLNVQGLEPLTPRDETFVYKLCIDDFLCTDEVTIDANWSSEGDDMMHSSLFAKLHHNNKKEQLIALTLPNSWSEQLERSKGKHTVHLMVVRSFDRHIVVNAKSPLTFSCNRPNGFDCDPLCCSTTWKLMDALSNNGRVAVKRNLMTGERENTKADETIIMSQEDLEFKMLLEEILEEVED